MIGPIALQAELGVRLADALDRADRIPYRAQFAVSIQGRLYEVLVTQTHPTRVLHKVTDA